MTEDKFIKIQIKPQSLKRNMLLKIDLDSGETLQMYFKRFMYKEGSKSHYREKLQDILDQNVEVNDVYLFLSESEQDKTAGEFIKFKSVMIQQIKSIRPVIPNNVEPFIMYLLSRIEKLERKFTSKSNNTSIRSSQI